LAGLTALRRVGQGLITLKLGAEGEMRVVKSIQDVVRLWKEGAEGKIVLVEDAGTTTLAPVLSKLAGVVCTSGALGSHLAIVTREFQIPALMGTKLETSESLDRRRVVIRPEGGTGGILLVSD
jgi:signal transduction protein with GAF and PtsI domain